MFTRGGGLILAGALFVQQRAATRFAVRFLAEVIGEGVVPEGGTEQFSRVYLEVPSSACLYQPHSQVLDHDVLMRDQAVHAVVASLPPVLGRAVIQQQRGSLLERQLSGSATHVVEFGDGLDLLNLWKRVSEPGQLIQIRNNTDHRRVYDKNDVHSSPGHFNE